MDSMESYRISPETGFLLENQVTELPGEYSAWIRVLEKIDTLVTQRILREKVEELPLLDGSGLQTHSELRRGHVAISFLAAGYVWQNGEVDVPAVLPKVLAIPLHSLSTRLGMLPVVTHADLVLANVKFNKPLDEVKHPMEDMALVSRIVSDTSYDVFFLVTANCELKFAPAIKHLLAAVKLSNERKRTAALANHLTALKIIINEVKTATALYHKTLDPKAFYNRVRPFLNGWNVSSNVFPNGLIYDGVSDEPIFCYGASAAQSPIFQSVDALLGVQHYPEQAKFLSVMRNYMINEHRQFLADIEKHSRVKEFVAESGCPELTKAFNDLLTATEEFRSFHLSIVTKFVVIPARTQENKFESLKSKGTGGQELIKFLKPFRDCTKSTKLPTDKDGNQERIENHEES